MIGWVIKLLSYFSSQNHTMETFMTSKRFPETKVNITTWFWNRSDRSLNSMQLLDKWTSMLSSKSKHFKAECPLKIWFFRIKTDMKIVKHGYGDTIKTDRGYFKQTSESEVPNFHEKYGFCRKFWKPSNFHRLSTYFWWNVPDSMPLSIYYPSY